MASEKDAMKIKALAPWFGNNRILAATVGKQLGRLAWCGVPFCGGAPELPYIDTRGGVATDLHRHIINLARCVRDEKHKDTMLEILSGMIFHPDELHFAQARCVQRDADSPLFGAPAPQPGAGAAPDPQWAADYFAACWMGLGGHAGKRTEFTQGLSLRYTSSGGDSARRFRSAVESLDAWHAALRVWSFDCVNAFDMLASVRDQKGHGLYVDAPWPEVGDEYRHAFTEQHQIRLAQRLAEFKSTRVVIRFGDHPMIRVLYPEGSRWKWIRQRSVNQVGNEVSEVLIVNGDSVP